VMAVVAAAVIKIGKKSLKNRVMIVMAASSFVGIFFFKIPFPVIVIGAGLIGLAGSMVWPEQFEVIKAKGGRDSEGGYVQICEDPLLCHINPSRKRGVVLVVVFVSLWVFPMAVLFFLSNLPAFFTEGLFFTKAAFLTFGGAYAVLAYIAQAGVEQYAWLTAPQMMDGLGLAETTPGPLIMVVQFVGFMAGWNYPGVLSPLSGALLGSLVATYFTFLPSFLFIFLGAPYIEKFRGNRKLSAALSSITAAVVGVVMNLAVWFGMHVLFPEVGGFNVFGAVVGLASFAVIHFFGLSIITVIFASGAVGLLYRVALIAFA